MSEELPPRDPRPAAPRSDVRPRSEIDWFAVEREPEFQELVRRRRAFVVPAVVFYLTWYMGFIVLTAVAPDFMGERVYEGLTVGYTLALTQFLMVLVLGIWYLRKSDREFDPLADRVAARYRTPEEPAPVEVESRHGFRHRPRTGRWSREPRP